MKRLLFYCVLLYSMLTGSDARAQAQGTVLAAEPTTVENLDATKKYAIYVRHCKTAYTGTGADQENAGYLLFHSGGKRITTGKYPLDESYLWTLEKNEDGGIIIGHPATETYIQSYDLYNENNKAESGFATTAVQAPYAATYVADENAYTLQGYTDDITNPNCAWLNYNTTDGLWVAYNETRAATFQFYEVKGELVSVTLNYAHEDFTYSVTKTGIITGAPAADLFEEFDYYTLGDIPEGNVTAENTTLSTTLTTDEDFPIRTDCVYRLGIRDNQTVIRISDDDVQTTDASNEAFDANNLWYFKRKPDTPFFTLHCVGSDDGKGVAAGTGSAKASLTTTPTAFVLRKTTHNAQQGFALQHADNGTSHLGDHSSGNIRLGTWQDNGSRNDAGSCFVATEVPTTELAALTAGEEVGSTPSEVDAMYVAGGTPIKLVRSQALIDAAAADASPANVRTLFVGEAETIRIADHVASDKYYRIVGRGDCFWENKDAYAAANGEVSQEQDSRGIYTATSDTEGVPYVATLWQFKELNGNKAHLTAANTGFYLGIREDINGTSGLVTTKPLAWSHEYTVEGQGGYWTFQDTSISGDNYVNVYYNPVSYNYSKGFCYWRDGLDDAGNRFRLLEVTEIPVTIGQTGYSSLCLPMAVSIPEGAKAYKVTNEAEAGYVRLVEVTGVIPAYKGFLVSGTPEEVCNLPIVTSPDEADYADFSDNILLGATAERRGVGGSDADTHEDYFCLDNGSDTPKFSRVNIEGNPVPANKAYIMRSSLSASSTAVTTLRLDFGGGQTGIHTAIEADAATTEYFDLQGRRVPNPTRGIYVTGDGKKVLFK